MKVKMLTKDGCPKCTQLKMFLEMGLSNKYKEDIDVIHKSQKTEEYEELCEKYGLQTAPVLIYGEELLLNTDPMLAEEFLRTRLGK